MIGIFGGSFNPIHRGHQMLAERLLHQAGLHEVWLLVSPHNPLKEREDLWDDDLRLELARIAVEGVTGLKVSDFEFHLPQPSFMVNTLKALCQTYPDEQFSLIIGADNWQSFPRWRDHEEILRRHHLIIYPREGYEIDATTLPEGVRLVDTPLYPISSTEIRDSLQGDRRLAKEWLHPEVFRRLTMSLGQLK